MKISAKMYDGVSSQEHSVIIEFTPNRRLIIASHNIDVSIDRVKISSRLGNTPRVLHLPDGQRCKSQENDKIDEILDKLQIKRSKIHKLERSWKLAVAAVAFIAVFVVFMLTAGADWTANFLAKALPQNTLTKVSKDALKRLDGKYLHKSNLSKEKKEKILAIFKKLTNGDKRYVLHFRSSPLMGANAFALPSGDIVLLDELVFLDKDKELRGVLGVLAHEKGHVVYRHGLRGLIKGTVATAVVSYITGDLSFIVTTLPTAVITSKYSREFETQADHYAKSELKRLHVSSKPLAKLFVNLEDFYKKKHKDSNSTNSMVWFSSHPLTKDRVKYFMQD